MKLNRLTTVQRVKMVKTCYKNGDSNEVTFCTLKGDYGAHERPTNQAVGKILNKFEETGSVTNIVRPVHYRFVRSTSNNAIVSESVGIDPRCSQELELSYGT